MSLPLLTVRGRTLPEAWERSLVALWTEGQQTRSQHAPKGSEATLDCTMAMLIEEPLGEPRIHRCQPGGLEDLWIYVEEVVAGVHDSWIKPEEGKWSYTYHQRLFDYQGIDQIESALQLLATAPHTRRAQGITWMPAEDLGAPDPPCLQRIWLRLAESERGYSLLMNCHWRSRDEIGRAHV